MTCNLTSRLQSIIPGIRRVLIQDHCLYALKKKIVSKAFSSAFSSRYGEDRYNEVQNRLEAVPYLELLNKEAYRVQQDLSDENDERLKDVVKRCSLVFNSTARNGKMIRGVALLKTYCIYGFSMDDATWNQWDSEKWKLASVLAWCAELVQAYILILDDIMDQSLLRRGVPCWYTNSDVGLGAINDALLLQSGIFKLLHKNFSGSENYMNLVHEFIQVTHETVYGQCIDMMFNPINQKPNFDQFTFGKYEALVEYKTANYTIRLPVHVAMHFAGGYSVNEFDITRKISLKLGSYFQWQDDRLDCFGKSELTGKLGNDIREGKCTWFSVKFLEEAPEHMKKLFLENYGVDDKCAISTVLELYNKANMLQKFEEFAEQSKAEIKALIESMNDIRGAVFYDLLAQLEKREK